MNNLGRGADGLPDEDGAEDETGHEPLPLAISINERRLQVRAYNFWTRLLRGEYGFSGGDGGVRAFIKDRLYYVNQQMAAWPKE